MVRHVLPILLLALSSTAAHAGELKHRLGASETLADVAKRLYGSSWKAIYIQTRNDIDDPRSLAEGSRLAIPACWTYTVRRGDSAAVLAKRYLGDSSRYMALMQANGIKDAAGLEVGKELLMPFHLQPKIAAGDTLASISRRYYRTTRYAAMLQEYNGGSSQLTPGQRITVPIFDRATLDVASRRYTATRSPPTASPSNGKAPAPAAPAAAARTSKPTPTPATARPTDATASLQEAVAAYRRGEFIEACGALESLLEDGGLTGPDRITLVSHLGYCAVALGDNEAARDYFRTWLELEPKASLNPITTSPKILAVFEEVAEASKSR